MDDEFREMKEVLREILVIQDRQAKMLLEHSEILVEHDERMDRVERDLEVLAAIAGDPIRGKADRKKR